ncbi:MAG: prolyl oligopeptidase family serine peptidase [Acidobacteriales bacterium]|nr:prolyl oligopeptidase family serine peptidase [Terriglobales bacterium]
MRRVAISIALILLSLSAVHGQQKPRVTLDEFFNSVDYRAVEVSPDGKAVLIGTRRADWKPERFRDDIWLWREGAAGLLLLTTSGHDSDPQWSPDGRWVAFLSDRRPTAEPEPEEEQEQPKPEEKPKPEAVKPPKPRAANGDEKKEPATHLYLLSMNGGEAFAVTRGEEEVHAFAWSSDSSALYFATRTPWSKEKKEAHKKEWREVVRFREDERGDVIARIVVAEVLARHAAVAPDASARDKKKNKEGETAETPGAITIASSLHRVQGLTISPNGEQLAFVTGSRSERVEATEPYEIYVVDAKGGQPRRLTTNQAMEDDIQWSTDGKSLFFTVGLGVVEGPYKDLQPRIYSVNVSNGNVQRWAPQFTGSLTYYDVLNDGALAATGRLGTEVQVYSQRTPAETFVKSAAWEGTYSFISAARKAPRVAVVYSAMDKPTEVYLAESLAELKSARAITSFNQLYSQRDLPKGRPYRWKADDGTTVEGMLFYPPGKFGAKKLRMFTLIHGGPADADGNNFGADWYDFAILAASNDWLVFRPNYRGSTGYGDRFLMEIVPNLVSVPGKDILTGVDALVKDGIADPDKLAIGGYSYGGYMTNWLITQTPRFKAAVTGAGAVEHAANWGNDDLTLDDAYFLGGMPWEAQQRYNDEAALFQLHKVRTPTHIVGGAEDVRVAILENYLLERALFTLKIPNTLLIFPGEGHTLTKNPWHGKIKVREELKWLEKYVPAK